MKNRFWVFVLALFCIAWLGLMVGASYWAYRHKDPVRIGEFDPAQSPRR